MTELGTLASAVGGLCRSLRPRVMKVWQEPARPEERKADGTIVTALDRELEARLFDALTELEPGLGFVGEEGGRRREGEPAWHVDPIDGTLNFSRRMPEFAMQVALVDDGVPTIGLIYEPVADSLSVGWAGGGAWRDDARMRVSSRPLEETLLLADISRSGRFVTEPDFLPRVRRFVFRMRCLGSVAIHLREVASGAAEAYIATRAWPSQPYDFAPGVLLVREAGGVASSFDGLDPFEDSRTLLAATPDAHKAIQAVLDPTR